jgi:hypothetical protein
MCSSDRCNTPRYVHGHEFHVSAPTFRRPSWFMYGMNSCYVAVDCTSKTQLSGDEIRRKNYWLIFCYNLETLRDIRREIEVFTAVKRMMICLFVPCKVAGRRLLGEKCCIQGWCDDAGMCTDLCRVGLPFLTPYKFLHFPALPHRPWRWRQYIPPKRWPLPTSLHDVKTKHVRVFKLKLHKYNWFRVGMLCLINGVENLVLYVYAYNI